MLKINRLHPEAALPRYATDGAAGLDLAAMIHAPVCLKPGERVLIPTGISIVLPKDHEGQVRPRSGLAFRHGVTVLNAPGTIDEDYRGEINVLLINHGQEAYTIAPGDRIAQLIVAPITRVQVVEVSAEAMASPNTAQPKQPKQPKHPKHPRGTQGFGSTGR